MKDQLSITNNQLQYLQLIYKFRFVTIPLLASHRKVSQVAVKRSLKNLQDKGMLYRQYNSSYKLHGKAARFCLSKGAINYLKDKDLNSAVLHSNYKNPRLSDGFVDQCLDIFQLYIDIQTQQPDIFKVLTRSELADATSLFPDPMQHLYLQRIEPGKTNNLILLEIIPDTQKFIIKKRIDQYVSHYEDGDWSEDEYPTINLINSNSRITDYIEKYYQQVLDSNLIEQDTFQIKAIQTVEHFKPPSLY